MAPRPATRSRVVAVVLLALAAVAGTCVAAYTTTARYTESTALVTHTYAVLGSIDRLHAHLSDAETGQRGYLLSGDERMLAPYRTGSAGAEAAYQRLVRLTRDNAEQQRRLAVVGDLLRARLAALNDVLGVRQRDGGEAAARLVARGPGQALMTRLRAATDELRAAEARLLQARAAAETARAGRARLVMLLAFGAALLIVGCAGAVIVHDVTVRERLEGRLRAQALADELTGLANRRAFTMVAEERLRLMRRVGRPTLLLFLDLDRFKQINDTHGHDAGDAALADFAGVLRRTFRDADVIARFGGDEFAVLVDEGSAETADVVRRRLDQQLSAFNATAGRAYHLAASVGVARCAPADAAGVDALLRRADAALYECKRARRAAARVA